MDRGRAGGFVTDNNLSMKQIKERQFKDHLSRLEKIKKRKAGSSHTLDNNPPVIVKAALSNPRKIALRHEFNVVVAKENKSLLKRISMILTAPPKITTKDYYEMKKLCAPGTVDAKDAFENKLREEKTKKFFENIKHVKPVYNPKQWEDEYKHQLFNQKFMRQVKYRRPKDFVDPFKASSEGPLTEPGASNNQNSLQNSGRLALNSRASSNSESFSLDADPHESSQNENQSRGSQPQTNDNQGQQKKTKSASHVDRIRAVKSQKNAPGPLRSRSHTQFTQQSASVKSSNSSAVKHTVPRTNVETTTSSDANVAIEDDDANDGGYEQDFEAQENGEVDYFEPVDVDVPTGTEDYELQDVSAALAAAAAAGPRQQSSRGQRRRLQQQHDQSSQPPSDMDGEDMKYSQQPNEYDDGFEPMTEDEVNNSHSASAPIKVVVFTGDEDYSHDGFYDEDTPANKQSKSADAEYTDDVDFVLSEDTTAGQQTRKVSNHDQQSRPKTDQSQKKSKKKSGHAHSSNAKASTEATSSAVASEIDTDMDEKQQLPAHSSSSQQKQTDRAAENQKDLEAVTPGNGSEMVEVMNGEHDTGSLAGSLGSSSGGERPRHRHHQHKHSSRQHSSSPEQKDRGKRRSRPSPKDNNNNNESRYGSSSGQQKHRSSGGNSNNNYNNSSSSNNNNNNEKKSSSKSHTPQRREAVEERKISIVSMTRPIKLMREIAASHHSLSLADASSPTNHNSSDKGPTATTSNQAHKAREGFDLQISYMDASVECWLINQETLLITVVGLNTEIPFDAEAVISEQELAMICDLPSDEEKDNDSPVDGESKKPAKAILKDLEALTSIATEITENIELRMDFGKEAKIILNLIHEIDPEEGVQASMMTMNRPANISTGAGANGSANGDTMPAAMNYHHPISAGVPFNVVADEEVEEILLQEKSDVLVLTGGIKMPVHFNLQNQSLSISNINKLIEYAKQQQRVEYVHILYRAKVVNEEHLLIVGTVVSNTIKTFKRPGGGLGGGNSNHNSFGFSGSGTANPSNPSFSAQKVAAAASGLVGSSSFGAVNASGYRPAVAVSQTLTFQMALPSVVQLDPDLFADFAANVVQSLKIEHDTRSGINKLLMQSST